MLIKNENKYEKPVKHNNYKMPINNYNFNIPLLSRKAE